ncbi:DUF1430 domain-containing protein [Bacillus paralicheniformis]|uniref:DUF1430 domain-containing protein n=1 Tax=Bacillus paralicheniformis TaxID=1648923 RepID=UPI00102DD225|nr:DUF1430 domain-containing protein [Bacillus paralicheniformis]MBC8621175.1 DUF1430 domain-containing protein [Robertmurraya crescens]MCJ8221354.1 DUF1430 domain-containing protein [Bacillus paralicheniformis]MCW4365853.1 DUF1430 domain-containing protein [Bacillus paralicheniformis]MEC2211782.1 DUF1430 domain-containing protein [Bacillus paralicheniformis]MED1219015.1 DUF1430 domain-containing protein [Bacillus paralicheniformis]
MKKTIYILFILFFISMNLSSYHYTLNKQVLYTLFSNKQALVVNYDKSPFKSEDFIKRLVEFSKKEKVNVSQYNFLDEKTLNIYTSNIKEEPSIHIRDKKEHSRYISNFKKSDEKNSIGAIHFPLSTWNIKYFDIDQISNVGIGNRFYISSLEEEVIKKAIKEFSDFGDVSIEDSSVNDFLLFNSTLLLLIVLSMLILFIGVLYFVIKNRKQLLLQKLWGYSKIKSLLTLPSLFLKPFTIIILSGALLLVTFALGFDLNDWLMIYIKVYIRNTLIAALTLAGFSVLITSVLYNNSDTSGILKGSTPFKKFQWLSLGLKLVVTIFLFNIISSSLSNLFDLKQQLENKFYWNKTQTVYKLSFANTGINYSDLKLDREKNDKVRKLYHELEQHKNAFIMDAENYALMGREGKSPVYFYTLNATQENEIFSPSGRSITISPNYLKINPITGANEKLITKKDLTYDPNTLNILVPKKYAEYQKKIIEAYKKQFFFQKVEVDNLYNEEMNRPLNALKIDQLKINIIYTENKQKYFSFNSEFGDIKNQNNIVDPIAIVFTDNVDSSFIGAYATSCLFFSDSSKTAAYDHITPYLKKTDTKNLIDSAISVYQELSDQIARLQNQFIQNLIGLVIALILSVAFLVSYIWSYYSTNAYRLYLKEIFGYSYWERNKQLIILSIASNALIGIGFSIYYKVFELLYFILLFAGIELIVLYFLSVYLNRKNMNKIIKGDRI